MSHDVGHLSSFGEKHPPYIRQPLLARGKAPPGSESYVDAALASVLFQLAAHSIVDLK